MAVTYSGDAATTRTNLGLGSLATLSAVGASEITDNSVGAAELNVSGNGTSGQLLASDGDGSFSWTTVSGGGDYALRAYTGPATWTKPAGLKAIKVTVVGGGGGGGASRHEGSAVFGGQGGGGGAAIEWIPAPSIPGPVAVTRGAGGTGGDYYPGPGTGGTGGTSSFGAFLSATGGGAGTVNPGPGPSGTPGAGGAGSGGNLNIPGGRSAGVGRNGSTNGSLLASPNFYVAFDVSGNGSAGVGYGGGGTGGYSSTPSNQPYNGGAGAGGVVIVEEFY